MSATVAVVAGIGGAAIQAGAGCVTGRRSFSILNMRNVSLVLSAALPKCSLFSGGGTSPAL